MKECLSGGSYLHRRRLLYRSTTNNNVTSEQNINTAAAEPHRGPSKGPERGHLMLPGDQTSLPLLRRPTGRPRPLIWTWTWTRRWPWRLLLLLNLGLILGLASALVAISNDIAALNKVAAGIWEHGDIFQTGGGGGGAKSGGKHY